jgi:spore coat polysaccharide biosynthesis protein SpsF (cytidylyltransferase family)
MKIVAIIQARYNSTRLTGKVLTLLLGKPVLWHIVNRVSHCKLIDDIIVATTYNRQDDKIVKLCKDNNILCFRGNETDVLDRYYKCALEHKIKNIVRITADCPLIDSKIIDLVTREYINGDYDYVTNTIEYTFPDGFDVEVFSFETLKITWKQAKLPSEREHVTPYIRNNVDFKKKNVYAKEKHPLYRLTLDYPDDYEFIKLVYEGIGKDNFNFQDIKNYLNNNPKLLEINQHHSINEGYQQSLKEDNIINGERVYLRELRIEDATIQYCNWLNDSSINKYLETKKINITSLKQYIKEKKDKQDCLFFGIFTKETNKHIGNVKLEPIDRQNKKTTLGILIGDKYWWGSGICTEVVKLIIKHSFNILGLNKINIGVITENTSAIICYLKSGMKIEQLEKQTIKHNDKTYDKLVMSIEKKTY